MRTFKLTDDCTLSGRRLRPMKRPIILSLSKEGGGYARPELVEGLIRRAGRGCRRMGLW